MVDLSIDLYVGSEVIGTQPSEKSGLPNPPASIGLKAYKIGFLLGEYPPGGASGPDKFQGVFSEGSFHKGLQIYVYFGLKTT